MEIITMVRNVRTPKHRKTTQGISFIPPSVVDVKYYVNYKEVDKEAYNKYRDEGVILYNHSYQKENRIIHNQRLATSDEASELMKQMTCTDLDNAFKVYVKSGFDEEAINIYVEEDDTMLYKISNMLATDGPGGSTIVGRAYRQLFEGQARTLISECKKIKTDVWNTMLNIEREVLFSIK